MPRVFVPFLTLALTWLGAAAPIRACDGTSDHAYRITAHAAIDALPSSLRGFLDEHREQLAVECAEPDPARGLRPAEGALADDAHFVWLDIAATVPHAAQRDLDITDFPRKTREARALCRRLDIETCGTLPWALEARHRRLVAAFRSQRKARVLNELALLVHLSTDAAMPFNVTRERMRAGSRSRHRAVQVDAVDRFHERLAYEVRVWPGRVTPVDEPLEAIFDTLFDSYGVLERIRTDDDPLADLLEARLEAGALLAARLITAAWTEAGQPELAPDAPTDASTDLDARAKTPLERATTGYAGSLDSTIFHRTDCPHVRRIKPENLIRFATPDEARAAGRKPCQRCKPGAE